jgi:hypothetical protein
MRQSSSSLSSSNTQGEIIERDESITESRMSVEEQLNLLRDEVESMSDIETVRSKLTSMKEKIFEKTGGHRILYEISQEIKILNNEKTLSDDLKTQIKEKIGFWINKL